MTIANDPHAALVAEAAVSSLKALRLAVEDLKAGRKMAYKRVAEEASTLGQCLGKIAAWVAEVPLAAAEARQRHEEAPTLIAAAALVLDRMRRLEQRRRCPRCGGIT